MNNKFITIMIAAMGFSLVACAPKDVKTETTESTTQEAESITNKEPVIKIIENETLDDEIYEGANMANPWVDSDKAGVIKATGFDLVAPSDATNIIYSYMPSTGMAQMNYNTDNSMWVYRVQHTEALEDISGIYCEWNYTGEAKVAGMDAMEYGYSSEPEGDFIDDVEYTRVVNWYDAQNKATHSLSVIGIGIDGLDTVVYAENNFGK